MTDRPKPSDERLLDAAEYFAPIAAQSHPFSDQDRLVQGARCYLWQSERLAEVEALLASVHGSIGGRASHGPEEDARCTKEWVSDVKEGTAEYKAYIAQLEAENAELRKQLASVRGQIKTCRFAYEWHPHSQEILGVLDFVEGALPAPPEEAT